MLKTYLPKEMKVNDKVLVPISYPYIGRLQRYLIAALKCYEITYRRVDVLSKNLRGKTDLYGLPYQPTKWIFIEKDKKDEILRYLQKKA